MEITEIKQSSVQTKCDFQFCMVCLDVHRKLCSLSKYKVEFKNLTGISLAGAMNYTPMFCSECAQRLINCSKFRDKSLRAYQLLSELVQNNEVLSLQTISSVDRARCQLTSSIVKKTFEPNHCDLHLVDNAGKILKTYVKNEKIDVPLEFENANLMSDIKCDLELVKDDSNIEDVDRDMDDDVMTAINKKEYIKNRRNTDIECIDYDLDMDYDLDGSDKNEGSFSNRNKTILKKRTNPVTKKTNKHVRSNVSFSVNDKKRETKKDKVKLEGSLKDERDGILTRTRVRITSSESVASKEVRPKRARTKKIGRPPGRPKVPNNCKELREFKISERSPEEQMSDLRARQETDTYKRSQYKCTDCYKGFQDENAFSTHMERHTDKYGLLACPICRIRVKLAKDLSKHVGNSHKTLYHCTKCTFVTHQKNSALCHSRWHDGKKYKCQHCEEEFIKPTSYFNHLRIKHPSDHVCKLCGYSFIGVKGLMYHMSRKHYSDNKQLSGPQCADCNICFASDSAYETHMKVSPKHAAPGSRKTNDPTPPRKYNPIREKERKRNKDKNSAIDCELCGIMLESRRKYYWHFRACHPHSTRTKYPSPMLMCDQCGKAFHSKCSLADHMATHSGESKPEQCHVCSKMFRYKVTLKRHMRLHSNSSYQCAHCAYETTTKGNLNRHMETHLNLHERKLYDCKECGKTFTTVVAMKNHMLHVHYKVPYPKRDRPSRPRAHAAHAAHAHTADYRL